MDQFVEKTDWIIFCTKKESNISVKNMTYIAMFDKTNFTIHVGSRSNVKKCMTKWPTLCHACFTKNKYPLTKSSNMNIFMQKMIHIGMFN